MDRIARRWLTRETMNENPAMLLTPPGEQHLYRQENFARANSTARFR